jgi:hypothetical protein
LFNFSVNFARQAKLNINCKMICFLPLLLNNILKFAPITKTSFFATKSSYIKVDVQPWLRNNDSNFGQNLIHQTSYIYKRVAGERTQARLGSPTRVIDRNRRQPELSKFEDQSYMQLPHQDHKHINLNTL